MLTLTSSAVVKMECDDFHTIFKSICTVENIKVTKNDTLDSSNVNRDLFTINFKSCKFAEFPSKIFVDFPNLSNFEMTDNGLKVLNKKFFVNAKTLKYLLFINNSISTIKNRVFMNMPQLEYLVIRLNKIKFLAVNAFLVTTFIKIFSRIYYYNFLQGLSSLKQMVLSETSIVNLKRALQPLVSINNLELSKNRIKFIDKESFKTNIQLTYIELTDNAITAIEEGSFDTILNIKRLLLNKNELVFAKTYKSNSVNLSNNKLKSVYISEITEKVEMENNFIEVIECTEKEMSVQTLKVSFNVSVILNIRF